MKNKIIDCLIFLWTSLVAFSFPICFGWIFLDISGHAKGYGYNLGSEKDVSIILGFIELIIWLILAVPSNIFVFRQAAKRGKCCLLNVIIFYIILSVIAIFLMGGPSAYLKDVFNI